MAFPSNDQITDAVTQTNVKVLGDAPALALGSLYQSVATKLPDTIYAQDVQKFCVAASKTSSIEDIAQLLAKLHGC